MVDTEEIQQDIKDTCNNGTELRMLAIIATLLLAILANLMEIKNK